MTTQERQLIQSALELLHRAIGLDDAAKAFKPLLRFADERTFPGRSDMNTTTSPGEEKTPPAQQVQGAYLQEKAELNGSENQGVVLFTEKEINSMPKEKRNFFKINGYRVHWRKKTNGVFELRITINKRAYYGASKDLQTAKKKLLEDLKREEPRATVKKSTLPDTIGEYALHYLDTFKKSNVGERTFKNYLNIVQLHVVEKLGKDTLLANVTASSCQRILQELRAEGKKRTAEELNSLLKWILDSATADKLIPFNPMDTVKIPKHKRTSGKCIPRELMQKLLSAPPTSRYDYLIMLVAYTGMRPIEIKSAVFERQFVTIQNAKAEIDEEPTFRRIPLHSALLPYVDELKQYIGTNTDEIARHFRKKIKGYRFYDLRHTFTTMAQECGATKAWVDYVTNHVAAQNVTTRVYTHWNDKFHLSQIELLRF